MSDHSTEPDNLTTPLEPEPESQPSHSAGLVAFAARLNAEPEAVQITYQYCLATLQAERGQAKLIQVEIRNRKPWCTFKVAGGEQITIPRPDLRTAEEQEMLDILRQILPEEAVEEPPLPTGIFTEARLLPPNPDSPTTEEMAAQAAELERIMNMRLDNAREAAETLRQMLTQAWTMTQTMRTVITESRQVTQAAWTAITEQRMVLLEVRSAMRRYERLRRDAELAPYVAATEEPERSSYPRPMAERDKQVVLSILNGSSAKEAARTFGVSDSRIKQIFGKEIRRLYRLSARLGLTQEDLAAISAQEQASLSSKSRPDASRVIELLKKMWGAENG